MKLDKPPQFLQPITNKREFVGSLIGKAIRAIYNFVTFPIDKSLCDRQLSVLPEVVVNEKTSFLVFQFGAYSVTFLAS